MKKPRIIYLPVLLLLLAGCSPILDLDWGPMDLFGWDTNYEAPDPPALKSPRNGAVLANGAITLSYYSVYARTYHLQVATDKLFNHVVYDQDTTSWGSQNIENLKRSTLYYWRVLAVNDYGSSGWSQVWGFYII